MSVIAMRDESVPGSIREASDEKSSDV